MRTTLMLVWMLCGCAGAAQAPAASTLRAAPIGACAVTVPADITAAFSGGFALTWPQWSGFGGWSDLRVTPDGGTLLAVSDDGHFLQAALTHRAGKLTAIAGQQTGALPHCPDKRMCDVESMSLRADGSWWLGVERQVGTSDQIWRFPTSQPPFQVEPTRVPVPPGLEAMPRNAGLEAMTALADDTVLAIAEGPEPVPATLPMWRWQAGQWHALAYPTTPDFRPVALAALPPGHRLGDALVLERKWLAATDAAGTRILALRVPQSGQVAETREVLRLDPAHCPIDNFEGLATRMQDGVLWLYLLSDDNQSRRQQTLLYAFTVQ